MTKKRYQVYTQKSSHKETPAPGTSTVNPIKYLGIK